VLVGGLVPAIFRRKKKAARPLAAVPAQPPVAPTPVPTADRNRRLPTFKATAADQVDRRRGDRFLTLRMRLRNAFMPSQPVVEGGMFAGRQELLASMISAIEDQRLHLVLYGERGIGKTSLLHILSEVARAARYIVIYSSCGSEANFKEMFHAAAGEIPLLFHSGFGPTSEEAEHGAVLADLLPEDFSPRQFADVCAKLTGTRVLLFVDEFDRAESASFRRDVAELIKFLSDRSVRVQLVIGGVAADLSELTEHIPSIRRNIFPVRIPPMTDEEVRALIANGEQASGLMFDPAAKELVVKISRGSPYIAVLVCNHAGISALNAQREVVLEEDVSAAIDSSSTALRARLSKSLAQQVDALLTQDGGRALTLLAGAALTSAGEFGPRDIDAVSPGASDATAAKRMVEQLASARMLVVPRGEAGAVRYGFVDEGLPPYLWFLGAPDLLLAAPPKARVKAS
jgi:hypothetical protein